MNIAVLSGKGGAGKTLVAVNLAAAAQQAVYIDCDVEEPNGRLFFKPQDVTAETISTLRPSFDGTRCTGCRRCVDFCRFNALIYIKEKPMLFPEICHACGGCQLVCPADAVTEVPRPVGVVEQGRHNGVTVVTGVLNPGESSGVPVIHAALQKGDAPLTIVDCPPGSACSVTEAMSEADYCILVAEPTAFGFHNFQMVQELTALAGKPCGVVINKQDAPYEPLEEFCREKHLPVLLRLPYSQQVASLAAGGQILSEADPASARQFRQLLERIGGEAE